jgi:hypothetical protein
MRVKPEVFRNWLEDFGKLVSKKRYTKLKYELWRPLYLWSKFDDEWEEIEINYFEPDTLYIVPRHNDKLSPDGVAIILGKDNSFGEYLLDVMSDLNKLCDIGASAKLAAEAISSSAAAISSLNDYYSVTKADLDYNSTCIDSIMDTISSWNFELNADGLRITENGTSKSLEEYVEQKIDNYNNKKEENNKMMKFDFGPVDSSVHMSMYGMAIKNASGTYVAYDANSKQIMDVDILNFEGANKFIYKMPATLSQIAAGDVVIHARKPMFVQEVREDNRLCVMDIFDGEEKTIVPAKSPFGFDFVTKVVSLFNFNGSADASNPFGNMLPLLLLSDSKSKDDNLLPLMLMAGGNLDMSNPMMLWALMGNRTNDPVMLAMAMGGFKQPTHSCACGDKCSCHKAE